jgi:hypothetical protein
MNIRTSSETRLSEMFVLKIDQKKETWDNETEQKFKDWLFIYEKDWKVIYTSWGSWV